MYIILISSICIFVCVFLVVRSRRILLSGNHSALIFSLYLEYDFRKHFGYEEQPDNVMAYLSAQRR